jgi:hypothetical protein
VRGSLRAVEICTGRGTHDKAVAQWSIGVVPKPAGWGSRSIRARTATGRMDSTHLVVSCPVCGLSKRLGSGMRERLKLAGAQLGEVDISLDLPF